MEVKFMENINEAMERIKILECPTGEVENRIIGILEHYEVGNKGDIEVTRQQEADKEGAQGYVAKIKGDTTLTVLATSGMDDYVAKVVEVYKS
jgi:hypothetical protein